MAFLNEYTGELNLKVLFAGGAGAGKTTNLRSAFKQTSSDIASRLFDLHGLETDAASFDFLPLSLGEARAQPVRLHLYTLPAHDSLELLNQTLFVGVDGIVLVIDSRASALSENERQLTRLNQWLMRQGRRPEDVPVVFQFNHRDAADALPIRALRMRFTRTGAGAGGGASTDGFEAVAVQDVGVLETIDAVADAILATMANPGAGRLHLTTPEHRPQGPT